MVKESKTLRLENIGKSKSRVRREELWRFECVSPGGHLQLTPNPLQLSDPREEN